MATPLDFAKALLNRLGLPQTQNRLVGLVSFAKKEGGHYFNGATYNLYNTMRGVPGSHKWGGPGNIQVFPNWQAGVEATALTMVQGNMRALLDALKSNAAPIDFLKSVTQTPWCPQSDPNCHSYATGDPYADFKAYANHPDPVGGSIADTGGPGVVGWVKDHPWLVASLVLLSAGGVVYYFRPNLFPSARRLLARENPTHGVEAFNVERISGRWVATGLDQMGNVVGKRISSDDEDTVIEMARRKWPGASIS